jgi:hypothetical protein
VLDCIPTYTIILVTVIFIVAATEVTVSNYVIIERSPIPYFTFNMLRCVDDIKKSDGNKKLQPAAKVIQFFNVDILTQQSRTTNSTGT